MRRAWLLAASLAFVVSVHAQPLPEGEPVTEAEVRDSDFGVSARHFGLERRVEMLQWRSTPNGYEKVWSERLIDSGGFAPGHSNPTAFPLRSQRWIAAPITIDGRPLDAGLVERLGEWRPFRPNFSALPGNLAATFQPEGDGLGSAENPLEPQVGDLRIQWRELTLLKLADQVELRDGRWQLRREARPAAVPAMAPEPPSRMPWWLGGALLALLVGWAVARYRRRR